VFKYQACVQPHCVESGTTGGLCYKHHVEYIAEKTPAIRQLLDSTYYVLGRINAPVVKETELAGTRQTLTTIQIDGQKYKLLLTRED
jgi:hypothetical protein